MKVGRQEPLQLVTYDPASRKFSLNPQALEFVSQIKGPIGIISVTGMFRTGKSFLTNRMILNRNRGFRVNPTVRPDTQGVWIWGKPILGQISNNQTINVLVLDVQGMSSPGQDNTYDMKIMVMCVLLSSVLVYNSFGAIEKSQVETLYNVLRTTQKVSGINTNCCSSLFWVLRDFSLDLKTSKSDPITSLEYLQQILNSPSNSQYKALIQSKFASLDCATLIRPLIDQASLQHLDSADYESLFPQFVDQLIQLRRRLLNNIAPKKINGKALTGELWAEIVTAYVHQLNSERLPNLSNAWEHMCESECERFLDLSIEVYLARTQEFSRKNPTQDSIKALHKEGKQQAIAYMHSNCKNNPKLPDCIQKLKQIVHEEYAKMMTYTQREGLQKIKQLMSLQYQTIQRKLKLKQIVSIAEYKREIQIFTEFCKKKATNSSSREYVYEFINRKIVEATVHLVDIQVFQAESKKAQLLTTLSRTEQDSRLAKKKFTQEKVQLQSRLQVALSECKQHKSNLMSVEENLLQSRINKEESERTYWQQMLNQKSDYLKIINQLKAKLSISENFADQINREKIILESELKKKDILYGKATENSNLVLEDQKESHAKLYQKYSQLKQTYQEQIKSLDQRHTDKTKELISMIQQLKMNSIEQQGKIQQLEIDLKTWSDKNQLTQMQKRRLSEEVSMLKLRIETESRQFQKKMSQNKLKTQKAVQSQQEIDALAQQNRRLLQSTKILTSELNKQRALNQQKLSFQQIQLQEYRSKYEHQQKKFQQLLCNFNNERLRLEEELNQWKGRDLQLRKSLGMQQISVAHLKTKNAQLQAAWKQRQDEITSTLQTYKDKQQDLEHSRMVLESHIRQVESDNLKNNRVSENKAEEQINRLNMELYRAKETYECDLEDIKVAFQQTLNQARSLHEIQRCRLENKLQDEKARKDRKILGVPEIEVSKGLRQSNQKLQDQILQLKKKMWDQEKDFRLKINQLESKLNLKSLQTQQLKNATPQRFSIEDAQAKLMALKINDLKNSLQDKDKQAQRLISQKSVLSQCLKQRTQEIARMKSNQEAVVGSLSQEVEMRKQQVLLLRTRNNQMVGEQSLIQKSILSKQESMLHSSKYFLSRIQKHQPTQIPTNQGCVRKQKIHLKLMQALKQVSMIEDLCSNTKRHVNHLPTNQQGRHSNPNHENTLLQRKIQMLSQLGTD